MLLDEWLMNVKCLFCCLSGLSIFISSFLSGNVLLDVLVLEYIGWVNSCVNF